MRVPPIEPDLELADSLRPRQEAQQPLPFLGKDITVLLCQGLEWFDHERQIPASLLGLPGRAHEAVEQHAAHRAVPE